MVESLIVIILVGMTAIIAVGLARERVLTARARIAANQFSIDLKAARLKAVSTRAPVDVVVSREPANSYWYLDGEGRVREQHMPRGVRIASSTSPITFRPNGSVLGGSTTVMEVALSEYELERWTVSASPLGIPRMVHERDP